MMETSFRNSRPAAFVSVLFAVLFWSSAFAFELPKKTAEGTASAEKLAALAESDPNSQTSARWREISGMGADLRDKYATMAHQAYRDESVSLDERISTLETLETAVRTFGRLAQSAKNAAERTVDREPSENGPSTAAIAPKPATEWIVPAEKSEPKTGPKPSMAAVGAEKFSPPSPAAAKRDFAPAPVYRDSVAPKSEPSPEPLENGGGFDHPPIRPPQDFSKPPGRMAALAVAGMLAAAAVFVWKRVWKGPRSEGGDGDWPVPPYAANGSGRRLVRAPRSGRPSRNEREAFRTNGETPSRPESFDPPESPEIAGSVPLPTNPPETAEPDASSSEPPVQRSRRTSDPNWFSEVIRQRRERARASADALREGTSNRRNEPPRRPELVRRNAVPRDGEVPEGLS